MKRVMPEFCAAIGGFLAAQAPKAPEDGETEEKTGDPGSP